MKAPVRVAVTGAAGQIGYSLLFRIAAGDMWARTSPSSSSSSRSRQRWKPCVAW